MPDRRTITQKENEQWERFTRFWYSKVRKDVEKTLLAYTILYNSNIALKKLGIPNDLFNAEKQKNIDYLLNYYNRMDRAIDAVNQGKYGLKFTDSKIDIIAPVGMDPEEYQSESISFGVLPIIWVAVAGAIIVGSIWGTAKIIESLAVKQRESAKKELIQVDKEMASKPRDIRQAWENFKNKNIATIKKSGILDRFLGAGTGSTIAIVAGIAVVLFAVSRGRR